MASSKATAALKFDANGVPTHIKHFRHPGMRSIVWDSIHALEKPIQRGSKAFTHVCLACVKVIATGPAGPSGWEEALCRVSNTSNAMKHMRSRHKDWEGHAMLAGSATGAAADDDEVTVSEGGDDDEEKDAAGGDSAGAKRKASDTGKSMDAGVKKAATTSQQSTLGTVLAGKVVVITGASGGIGAAVATRLATGGARVVLGARRMDALEQTRDAIVEATGEADNVLIRVTDVTKRQDLHDLVKAATDRFGDVDILVNNAGVMPFELLRNVNQDSWDRVVDINCKGVLNGIAAVLPRMLERKAGHIVNISSDAGRKVFAGLGVYSASKMFVEAVSQALRLENVGSGLKVTSIQPGNVATELVQHGNSMSGVDEEAMKLYGAPSGYQVLQAKDVANAVFYAVTQPPYVAVNEILVEPRDEPI